MSASHRATVAAIYQHLEDYAESLGEVTDRAREIAAGKFDPPALELSTGDPRFDPDQPIVINGYRFIRDPQA